LNLKPASGLKRSVEASAPAEILRRSPQQARSRARIARVLDSAERLLIREGAEALNTSRVAAEAGISVGSLYQYFPDKGAIFDALARRYLDEFEGLMDELVERALREDWPDLVGALIDSFADRYRAEPGYRALWFGRHLSEGLRAADRRNKQTLAKGVRRILVGRCIARDGAALERACHAAVLTADTLLQEAFRERPSGDPALLEEAKVILRGYLEEVAAR
jgi:AcrR family transcriptional regulator